MCLEAPEIVFGIEAAGSQGEMQIRAAPFVIVQMHMPQACPVSLQQLVSRVVVNEQVAMPDIQMESNFGQWFEQL
ncbi:hypothetical protein SDC9_198295 [bioreactor metagenome]|uniref:Uncharacterized protein n=1 Tax=bioreactor metagenome TaxID=1076179 RepID=A0A645IU50_9ZZZZ